MLKQDLVLVCLGGKPPLKVSHLAANLRRQRVRSQGYIPDRSIKLARIKETCTLAGNFAVLTISQVMHKLCRKGGKPH